MTDTFPKIRHFLKSTNLDPKINEKALQDYFLYQSILGRETLFNNIFKVREGEILTFDLRNQKLLNSHQIKPLAHTVDIKSYDDYKYYIKDIIIKQTIDALDTDLDLTFLLSGGIDSNLILSIADHYFPE